MDKLQPAVVVVMDNLSMAVNMAVRYPLTRVVHRTWHKDDAEWWAKIDPLAYVNSLGPGSHLNLFYQVLNEPIGAWDTVVQTKVADWLHQVMNLGAAQNKQMVVGNWSMGNPDVRLISQGTFDQLIHDVWIGPHVLGLHEYWTAGTTDVGLVGRFEHWVDRARVLGLDVRPQVVSQNIVLTESGHDVGGGAQDGWRAHLSAAEYFTQLLAKRKSHYQEYNLAQAIFCYGAGAGGSWRSFDLEGEDGLLDALSAYVEIPSMALPIRMTPPDPITLGVLRPGMVTAGANVNVRDFPAAEVAYAPVGNVKATTLVHQMWSYRPTRWKGNGHTWTAVRAVPNGPDLWVAEVATIADATPTTTAKIKLQLNVPYRSQTAVSTADAFANDCGVAAALMLHDWFFLNQTGLIPTLPTVDDVSIHSPLASNKDAGLTPDDVQRLLVNLGHEADLVTSLDVDLLDAHLALKIPTVILCTYKYLNPGDKFQGGHFAVVIGNFDDGGFLVADPYHGGPGLYVSRQNMVLALSETATFSSKHNVGITLL